MIKKKKLNQNKHLKVKAQRKIMRKSKAKKRSQPMKKKQEKNLKKIRKVRRRTKDQGLNRISLIRIIILVQRILWELLWHFVQDITYTHIKAQCKN
jgi:hypothetical protein